MVWADMLVFLPCVVIGSMRAAFKIFARAVDL
jgi:hypothetical protein